MFTVDVYKLFWLQGLGLFPAASPSPRSKPTVRELKRAEKNGVPDKIPPSLSLFLIFLLFQLHITTLPPTRSRPKTGQLATGAIAYVRHL